MVGEAQPSRDHALCGRCAATLQSQDMDSRGSLLVWMWSIAGDERRPLVMNMPLCRRWPAEGTERSTRPVPGGVPCGIGAAEFGRQSAAHGHLFRRGIGADPAAGTRKKCGGTARTSRSLEDGPTRSARMFPQVTGAAAQFDTTRTKVGLASQRGHAGLAGQGTRDLLCGPAGSTRRRRAGRHRRQSWLRGCTVKGRLPRAPRAGPEGRWDDPPAHHEPSAERGPWPDAPVTSSRLPSCCARRGEPRTDVS
jgi:hypothetical protein